MGERPSLGASVPDDVRIGAHVGVDALAGFVVGSGQDIGRRAEATSSDRIIDTAALTRMVTDLVAATPSVTSLCFEADEILRRQLTEHVTGPVPSVALLQIRPMPPKREEFGQIALRAVRPLVRQKDVVTGGHNIFGSEVAPLDLAALDRAADRWSAAGVENVAVAAAGAVVAPDHEQAVADRLARHHPEFGVWLSHECGGLGLAVRESLAVMHAVLADDVHHLADALDSLVRDCVAGSAGCYVLTSDGGRITSERMRNTPLAPLGSDAAALILGSAAAVDAAAATVLLVRDGIVKVGRLVDGLPEVPADLPLSATTQVATIDTWTMGTAVSDLELRRGAWSEALTGSHVIIVGGETGDAGDVDRVCDFARSCDPAAVQVLGNPRVLRARGAAAANSVARIDRIVNAPTPERMSAEISAATDRAYSLLAAGGAQPGTERVTSMRTYALQYLLGDTYRIHLRAAASSLAGGHADHDGAGPSGRQRASRGAAP